MNVSWNDDTLSKLRIIFDHASSEDQERIAETVITIREELSWKSAMMGESRRNNERVWFIAPLMIIYQIDVENEEVEVTHVSRLGVR